MNAQSAQHRHVLPQGVDIAGYVCTSSSLFAMCRMPHCHMPRSQFYGTDQASKRPTPRALPTQAWLGVNRAVAHHCLDTSQHRMQQATRHAQ
ncbi:hypothetical protein, partial [Xanthomonas vasicola]|uniref:hypothetical protein n=1 Tax=Xanthomonas vasicola TaxID=56459 RepID=UPI001E36E158